MAKPSKWLIKIVAKLQNLNESFNNVICKVNNVQLRKFLALRGAGKCPYIFSNR